MGDLFFEVSSRKIRTDTDIQRGRQQRSGSGAVASSAKHINKNGFHLEIESGAEIDEPLVEYTVLARERQYFGMFAVHVEGVVLGELE